MKRDYDVSISHGADKSREVGASHFTSRGPWFRQFIDEYTPYSSPQSPSSQCRFYHAKKQDSSRIDGMSARRRAVAASRCRKPTACSRYPAIRGCSTRLTPSCRFRRTLSRAVRLGPSSSSRAGCGILNYLTQTCNSKLFLALR